MDEFAKFASNIMSQEGPGSIGFLCGVHLCGSLSESFLRCFMSVEAIRGMVLVPCCLMVLFSFILFIIYRHRN